MSAAEYRGASLRQWSRVAPAWYEWADTFDRWLGEGTELMLDLAQIGPNVRVLDVAAGAGGQSVAAARRGAEVVAVDFAPEMLAFAERAAVEAGVSITTIAADAESLPVAPASFDAVICRLGFQYLAEPRRGLQAAFEALRPGGRLALIAFTSADRNAFVSHPIRIIRRSVQATPPSPDSPGPFALGDGRFERLAESVGFGDIVATAVGAPLRFAAAAECVRFEESTFGALGEMLERLPHDQQKETWAAIEDSLRAFEDEGEFIGPCELLIGGAQRPEASMHTS